MIFVTYPIIFIFSLLVLAISSASCFALRCKTGNILVKNQFILESEKVSSKINEFWNCNQNFPSSFVPFVQSLDLDEHYTKCITNSLCSKVENKFEFERRMRKCGAYVCKKIKESPDNQSVTEGQEELIKIEVNLLGDNTIEASNNIEHDNIFNDDTTHNFNEPDEDLSDCDESSWTIGPGTQDFMFTNSNINSRHINHHDDIIDIEKDEEKKIDVQMVGLILSAIGLVIVVVFMILRAVFPLENFPFWPQKSESQDVKDDQDALTKTKKLKDEELALDQEEEKVELPTNHFKKVELEHQSKNYFGAPPAYKP